MDAKRRTALVVTLASVALAASGCGVSSDDPLYGPTAVAFDGTRHLVATEATQHGAPSRIEGAVLASDLASSSQWSVPNGRGAALGAMAVGRGRVLMTWSETDGVWGAFFDFDGVGPGSPFHLVGKPPDPFQAPTIVASLGFDGQNFILSWIDTDWKLDGASPLRVARASPAGEILDPGGTTVREDPKDARSGFPEYSNGLPAMASSGRETLLVWAQRTTRTGGRPRLLAARLLPDGSIPDVGGFVVADGRYMPAIVWDGSAYLVVSVEDLSSYALGTPDADGPVSLRGLYVGSDGRVSGEVFSIATGWATRNVCMTANGDVALVVWNEGYTVRAARVNREGRVISPGGFDIGRGDRPSVGPGASGFVVVWNDTYDSNPDLPGFDYSRIWVRSVGANGVVGDPVLVRP